MFTIFSVSSVISLKTTIFLNRKLVILLYTGICHLVLVYTQEGSLGAYGVMITQVFVRAMVAPGTRTFMCPPRNRAM